MATAGYRWVGLSWTASIGTTATTIYRTTSSGGIYTKIGDTFTTSYADLGLTNGTTYYYIVRAVNDAWESRNSNEASATPALSGREICVSNSADNNVEVFDATQNGDGLPLRTITSPGLSNPRGIALNTAYNEILVANGNNSIMGFALTATGSAAPLRTISGTTTGLNSPWGIAVDDVNQEILVANSGNNSVTAYPLTATVDTPPLRTISGPSTGLDVPRGIAVATINNEILISNNNNFSLTVYPRDAFGNSVPPRTLSVISGSTTDLDFLDGIALDKISNDIYVCFSFFVLIYSHFAEGNIPPLGGYSLFDPPGIGGVLYPYGVAVDEAHEEVVIAGESGSGDGSAIVVFPQIETYKNVPLLRTIQGPSTGLNWPMGITLCK